MNGWPISRSTSHTERAVSSLQCAVGLGCAHSGAWLFLVVTDRLFPLTGYLLHFGLRERPLTFAHEAALLRRRRASRSGTRFRPGSDWSLYLPQLAGPQSVPGCAAGSPQLGDLRTYRLADAWLNRGDPRWLALVRRMGDPLIMLDHQSNGGAEATLVASTSYRCVYWDPSASVFIPQARFDQEMSYPTVNFAARHFAFARRSVSKNTPEEDYAEARSLIELALTLNRARQASSPVRLGVASFARPGPQDAVFPPRLVGCLDAPRPWHEAALLRLDTIGRRLPPILDPAARRRGPYRPTVSSVPRNKPEEPIDSAVTQRLI